MEFRKLDIKQVEEDLARLIERLQIGDKISVTWVKDFTYNFNAPDSKISQEYFGRLLDFLPRRSSDEDLKDAVRILNDAWNCFPQKIMGGISPQDKMFEGTKREKDLIKEHFTNARDGLDEYLSWSCKEVLPNYEKSLKNSKLNKSSREEAVGVAGVFLEICGQLGMFDLRRIHPDFFKDFSEMFEMIVVGPKISKDKINEHLKSFLSFLEIFYGVTTPTWF